MPVVPHTFVVGIAMIVLAAAATALPGDAPRPSAPADSKAAEIVKLGFLAGSWKGSAWGGDFHAYYSTPEGGKVLSSSELHKEGKVVFHEFEKFESVAGQLRLQPYPNGKPAAAFALESIDTTKRVAIFVNPENDYPKRLEYARVAEDRLVITLSNPDGRSEKFDLRAVAKKDHAGPK